MLNAIRDFLRLEAAGGVILVSSALLALIVANSPLSGLYGSLIELPVEVRIGAFAIAKPLLLWINDGLMSLFFLLIGLELKREFVEGELSDRSQIVLPALGAVGGMLAPALIYVAFNHGNAAALQGWAIPAATDIAFALAVLALLGKRVPLSLRVFLVSVAIFDDVGAIAIIALFYTRELSIGALGVAAICLALLLLLNRRGVLERTPYLLVGVIMWAAVLKSGVHATLAGVVLAFFIPLRNGEDKERSPLHELEHDLHTGVAFVVLPLFAFANAGVALGAASLEYLLHPVPLGIFAGLFVGKQLGVFALCWLAVRIGWARLPAEVTWSRLYGAALLCGVGFTMSLFIGSLAFESTGVNMLFDERLGIIGGSVLAGVCGYLVLRATLPRSEAYAAQATRR
jgi:Na+:H+ antiporter, NhaA family